MGCGGWRETEGELVISHSVVNCKVGNLIDFVLLSICLGLRRDVVLTVAVRSSANLLGQITLVVFDIR